VIIPLCLAKDEELYAESEIWTFYAPLADEIIERLLGFFEYFDDLCFFFSKCYIDPVKISQQLGGPDLSLSIAGDGLTKVIFPSELDLKTPVDSLVYHTLFDPDWDKHLLKVVNHKKEEDISSSSESEYERDQAPDDEELVEPNHDLCEDCEEFKFDKTGSRVDKSFKDPYRKFAEGVDMCVSGDCICTPLLPLCLPLLLLYLFIPLLLISLRIFLLLYHLLRKLHLLQVLLLFFGSFLMFSVVVR
jgi:hypothetical protein